MIPQLYILGDKFTMRDVVNIARFFKINDVLGDVCRSRREEQTGEDVRQDVFEVTAATTRASPTL